MQKIAIHTIDADIWKLNGMTEQAARYGYAVGLHLVTDVKAGTAPRSEVHVDAQLDEELTRWMHFELGVKR